MGILDIFKKQQAPEPDLVVEATLEEARPIDIAPTANPHVKVIELNGKKYNEIFDPVTWTTRRELLVE